MAAGRGVRLRPLTETIPKPLVPIAGRGTLLHLLEAMPNAVDRIILIVGYLEEKIHEVIGTEFDGRPVAYCTQSPLDGTGGAIRQARSLIQSETFLVINGDDLYAKEDLENLAAHPRSLLGLFVPAPIPMDAWFVDENEIVERIGRIEPQTLGLLNVGAYHLGQEWFETQPVLSPGKQDEWSLPHAIPQLVPRYPYRVLEATYWYPCGTHEEIARAEAALTTAL